MPLFAKKPTPKEAAKAAKRETRRTVRQSQRDVDRELRDLDRTETQVVTDIKKRARAPGVNPATDTSIKTLAKQLVQIRSQKEKLIGAKAQLGAMEMKTSLMATQIGAATAVGSVTGAMKTANEAMNNKEVMKMMNEFNRQNEIMNVKEEMMDDALADAFDSEGVEEGAEDITNQVLAELGVELDGKLVGLDAPMSKPVGAKEEKLEEDDLLDQLPDLKARLDAL
mmetsp:Transcript_36824/g.54090  ORF Transcript_36824/g.54090 Transcript_36824/m.54090 type:complete len:225 (-) Transcript_36824:401-1075(-)|eukprot:CAMPEP_0195517758 /NCGR_PEP_ID=MMETSP0794_2-20130614/11606_1 /TAXON_ID=515487 /ORGANISM="Stephanopyxis turris, Strain CCMP 815" /LENGTH=224 /DNA_ID=CAMNT_0040646629 /DNA_START=265 /DNA_END=939 /DNA_ORIENTATION=-